LSKSVEFNGVGGIGMEKGQWILSFSEREDGLICSILQVGPVAE